MNTKIKLGICLVFAILFLFPLVSSAPPVTTVPQFTEGIVIEYPAMEYIKQGTTFDFHFHLFNSSDGRYITTGVDCYFHLYNASGNHIYEGFDDVVSHNFDYSFKVDGGNFTNLGNYYYITQCNNTARGGYIERAFQVNPMGVADTEARSIMYMGVIIGVIAILIFFGFLAFKFMETDDTFVYGLFFLLFSIVLSVYVLFLGHMGFRDFLLTSVSNVQGSIFASALFGLTGIMFIAFLFFIMYAIKQLKIKKDNSSYGEGYNHKTKTYDY